MSDTYENHRVYRFGEFVLDVDRGTLIRVDQEVRLRPKSFDVLRYLVEHQGRLVSRDELLDSVWGDTVVTEDAVTQCLIDVRRALGDTSQSIIRTVPRRGYLFELPVAEAAESSGPWAAFVNKSSVRAWAIGIGGVAICLALLWMVRPAEVIVQPSPPKVDEVAARPSIAVLPFAVMSDDRQQSYFADGMSEEILNMLARQRGIRVIARTSSFSYRGRGVDVSTIAEELNVTHVLEGSLRNDGKQIRVNVQLVDARSSEYLWTESFDRELSASGLFAIQREIAETVSESLKAELSILEHERLNRIPTANLEALDAYFEGRAKMETRDPEQLREAFTLFETAIEIDPGFALAYVALADVYRLRGNYGSLSNKVVDQGMDEAIDAALRIDDKLGEAHASLANLLRRRGQFDAAERAFQDGIELSPNYAPLYQWYSEFLRVFPGRSDDAMAYGKMSVALDPRSAVIRRDYGIALASARKPEEANRQFDISIEIDPTLAVGYAGKADLLHYYMGDIAAAIPLYQRAHELAPTSPSAINSLSYALIDLGYFDLAEHWISKSMASSPAHPFARQVLTVLHVLRDEHDEAADNARVVLSDVAGYPPALLVLRDFYLRKGKPEMSLELYRRYESPLFDESSQSFDLRGWTLFNAIEMSVVLMELGRTDFAERLLQACLDVIVRSEREEHGPPALIDVGMAKIYSTLGDTEAALDALRRAVDRGWRSDWRYTYQYDSSFEKLRDEPEFHEIFETLRHDIDRQRRQLEADGSIASLALSEVAEEKLTDENQSRRQ